VRTWATPGPETVTTPPDRHSRPGGLKPDLSAGEVCEGPDFRERG